MTATIMQHLPGALLAIARLCAWLVLLVVIFVPLEQFFALRRERVWRPAMLTDLGYYFISSLVPTFLLGAPLAVVAWATHSLLPDSYYAMIAALPLWARLAAALVIGEIGFYWGHRLSHEIPFLWRFHAVHHSAEHLDWLVNTRGHPVDMVLTRLCGLVPLYIVGLGGPVGGIGGSLVPVIVVLVGTIWGFFIHANLRWRFGPLEWLVATPAFHHWHHSRIDHIDRNYASMLPIVDRVFGTLHLPRKLWPTAYGTETVMPDNLSGQLLQPLARAPRTQPVAP